MNAASYPPNTCHAVPVSSTACNPATAALRPMEALVSTKPEPGAPRKLAFTGALVSSASYAQPSRTEGTST